MLWSCLETRANNKPFLSLRTLLMPAWYRGPIWAGDKDKESMGRVRDERAEMGSAGLGWVEE